MAKITLYADNNYGGASISLDSEVENLKSVDFNDKASSCVIESGTWVMFTTSGFRNEANKLGPGRYPTPKDMGVHNDWLSSLRPIDDPR